MNDLVKERRKDSIAHFVRILFFGDSRKVSFGLWGFIVASVLIWKGRLDGAQWIEAFVLSSALVGGGTVADKWLDQKGGKVAAANPQPQPPL
jgi:hypothetical protein